MLAPPDVLDADGFAEALAKLAGVDLATNVPPEFLLLCHNELCYNPLTIGKIALYCVRPAPRGGETIVARNADLGARLPARVAEFVREHGGVRYSRAFWDARDPNGPVLGPRHGAMGSFQAKCALPDDATRAQAHAHFVEELGFRDDELLWTDEHGGGGGGGDAAAGDGGGASGAGASGDGEAAVALRVVNHHPGFVRDDAGGLGGWWNIAHTAAKTKSVSAADGTPFPKKLVAEIQRAGWADTCVVRARARSRRGLADEAEPCPQPAARAFFLSSFSRSRQVRVQARGGRLAHARQPARAARPPAVRAGRGEPARAPHGLRRPRARDRARARDAGERVKDDRVPSARARGCITRSAPRPLVFTPPKRPTQQEGHIDLAT